LRQCIAVVLLCLLFMATLPGAAQESTSQGQKTVAFVDDSLLHTSSLTDVGGDGLNRLAEIFQQLGAETRSIKLEQPVPSDVDVIVLARPTTTLRQTDISNLWGYLSRGGHLLLAFDPNGINKVNTDRSTSGLNKLLWADYGIGMDDDALVESWFGPKMFQSLVTTLSPALPENFMRHAIIAPLLQYDVPVYVWAARSVQVDALSRDAVAYPLLFTETTFGETNRNALRGQDTEPIQLNIGQDQQGRLLLGGIAENTSNGSRVALLGDSEMVQNVFGLTRFSTDDVRPRYPGNYIFAERLAAWLLGLPEENWPPLPSGFTWISLDGSADDWTSSARSLVNPDTSLSDIQRVQAFYNDQYLYVLIETTGVPPASASVTMTLQDQGGTRSFVLDINEVALVDNKGNKTLLPNGAMSIGQVIEARVPRSPLSAPDPITAICLSEGATSGKQNCLNQSLRPPLLTDIDPVPVRPVTGPQAFLFNEGNLRVGPDPQAPVLTALPGRTRLKLIGRTEASDWVKVYDGRWEGWISLSLLAFSADIESLPVLPK
jgi:ABC transporter family protein/SH3 domain-containing protein